MAASCADVEFGFCTLGQRGPAFELEAGIQGPYHHGQGHDANGDLDRGLGFPGCGGRADGCVHEAAGQPDGAPT